MEPEPFDFSRGRARRELAKAIVLASAMLAGLTMFMHVVAPGYMGPKPEPGWADHIPIAAVLGQLVGLAWMVRIYRADPEPDQHAWRYLAR